MNHNEIRDRVEDLGPVAVRLFDSRKMPGISESHGSMTRDGFQKDAIFLLKRR
jgi:hypothetical protein